jgi:hypothetical protein
MTFIEVRLYPFFRRTSISTILLWSLVAAHSVSLAGCGYSATRLLPAEYQTIFIEPFQNRIPITEEVSERLGFRTNLPELEEKATRGVIDRFLFDGNLRIVTDPQRADLVLHGALRDFSRQPVLQADDSTVEEYRLNLVAEVTLRDSQGKVIWENSQLIGDTTYFVSGTSAKSESSAVGDLITDFSRRIVEGVIEYW